MKTTLFLFLILILSSFSIAQNWSILNIPNANRYDDVFFLDENLGWAVNTSSNKVYKSIDGGQSWNIQFSTNLEHMRNIEFINENIGFLGTLTPNFYKTNDGGATWEVVNIPNVEAICGLDAVGDSTVYGCGAFFEPAYIIKSTDAGGNWSFIDMSSYATALVEVLFLDENVGLAAGKNETGGIIIKTTDGGQSWTEIYNSGLAGEYVWKLQQLHSNADVLFASIQSFAPHPGKLAKSLNGGQTWTTLDIVTGTQGAIIDPGIQGVGFITENHGWASGHLSSILETLDGGQTWSIIAGFHANINRFQVFNENLVFAAGTRVFKYTDNVGLGEFPSIQPKELEIKIAPNPIDDKLNVSIFFEKKNHMVITLFDQKGRKIKQLARETILFEGEQVYSFNFPYPSGIYYVHFHSDVEAKSIKIVKD